MTVAVTDNPMAIAIVTAQKLIHMALLLAGELGTAAGPDVQPEPRYFVPGTQSGRSQQRRDQIASLSSLEARKATFLLALIWICSPVAGLRPSAGSTIPHLQYSEPEDLHPLTLLQVRGDEVD